MGLMGGWKAYSGGGGPPQNAISAEFLNGWEEAINFPVPPTSAANYSFCYWLKFNYTSAFTRYIEIANATPDYHQIAGNSPGNIIMTFFNGSPTDFINPVAIGEWWFISYTVSGTSVNVYWAKEGTASLSTTSLTSAAWTGGAPTIWRIPDYGQLAAYSRVRAWDAVLTSGEMDAEFHAQTFARSTNLIGSYPLSDTTGTDDSGNSNTATFPYPATWDVVTGPAV